MRSLLAIGLFGGLLYLGSRVWNAKKLGEKAVVRTANPHISSITLSGITIETTILVDNPTNGSIQMTQPVITLTSGGKYIASSVPSKNLYTVAPLSQSSIGKLSVDISWQALAPYISNLVSRIPVLVSKRDTNLQTLEIPLEYKYTVYVDDLFIESNPIKLV